MTFVFDGDRQYGQVDSLDLSAEQTITLAWWARWFGPYASDFDMMLEFTPDAGSSAGSFWVCPNDGAGAFVLLVRGNVGTNYLNFNRPTLGHLHFYVVTLSFAAAAASEVSAFYLDTVLQSSIGGASANNNTGAFANSSLNVMSRAGPSLNGLGSMQGLSIYSGQVSTVGVYAMYAAGPDAEPPRSFEGSSAALLHHWRMDGRSFEDECIVTGKRLILNAMPWIESGDQEDEERPETAEFQDISSTVTVAASVTSAMQQTHTLTSAVSVTATASAAMAVAEFVSSTVSAAVSVTSALQQTHTLTSAVAVTVQVSAAVTIAGEMVSAVVIQSVVSADFGIAIGPPYCLCAAQWISAGASVGANEAGQWVSIGGEAGQMFCECEDE